MVILCTMNVCMKKIRKLLKKLGPGFITGASDDDPSGIATYSQTGALFGYSQLWTALFTFPFMTVIQEMCGRIGLVTGKGLAAIIRRHYPKSVLYFAVSLLVMANTINIGADLGAMAASLQLLFNVPILTLLIGITGICLLLQVLIPYHFYANILKYLTLSLFAYVITAFVVQQDWPLIFKAMIMPEFSFHKEYLLNIVALLGTTISPYLFFWQASEEVEEEVENGKLRIMGIGTPKFNKRDIKNLRFDTIIGMFFSNLVMFFIILTTASTLGKHGITDIQSADQAAQALQPLAGNFAYLLFAFGIIGTGLLAIPVLAGSTAYAVSEAVGWKTGLYRKFNKAHGFYGVIMGATIIGLLMNFASIPPFKLLYYTAVLNGLCAVPLMVLILLISNNKSIMNKHTNGIFSNILGVSITGIMALCAVALLFSFFTAV